MDKAPVLNTQQKPKDFRLIVALASLAAIAIYFWLGSRYPALNEKAMMGGDSPISGLSFNIVYDLIPSSPFWWQVTANTANWISTNLRGMTFGVIFGASMLTALSLIKSRTFQTGFNNAALGALIGAPLGVCVNCAMPIALGMHLARMRLEATLSTLFASPTLNIIVVTMSFVLLPLHIAIVKLVLSLALVLVLVPLLCRYVLKFDTKGNGETRSIPVDTLSKIETGKGFTHWIARALKPKDYVEQDYTISAATLWFAKAFGRNFFFLSILTVPMMILAALVSAMIATTVSPAEIAWMLPNSGITATLLWMFGLAVVASIAPAPIALDVILTVVLLNTGWADHYAMVVLIALGTFSFYPFVIIWKAISPRVAVTLWATTVFLSLLGGVVVHEISPYFDRQSALKFDTLLYQVDSVKWPVARALPKGEPIETLREKLDRQKVSLETLQVDAQSSNGSVVHVQIMEASKRAPITKTESDAPFSRVIGTTIGLVEEGVISPIIQFGNYMKSSGIAAGDIHNDGWVDIVTKRPGITNGLSVYANVGGHFVRQSLDLGPADQVPVHNVALADIDGDAQLDLLVSTVTGGEYLFYNQNGTFSKADMTTFGGSGHAVNTALAFGDMDVDGDLDIILGRWASQGPGQSQGIIRPEVTRTRILWNEGNRNFTVEKFDHELPGQTLTLLIDDFDNDGYPDVLKGDDNRNTDQITFFGPDRRMDASKLRQPFPYVMRSSMSYDIGDWNNDLLFDYYGAQNSHPLGKRVGDISPERIYFEICSSYAGNMAWSTRQTAICADQLKAIDRIRGGKVPDASGCARIKNPEYQTLCAAARLVRTYTNSPRRGPEANPRLHSECRQKLSHLPVMQQFCNSLLASGSPFGTQAQIDALHIPEFRGSNVLMTANRAGSFDDMGKEQNIQKPGWSWTSRLVDLDQDGWQDILSVTGIWLNSSNTTSNVFYHNSTTGFSNQTKAFGFEDVAPTYSYVTLDYDRDGDVDVIRDNTGLRMIVHRNDRPAGSALWVHLRDQKGNSMGVGAQVTICVDGETRIRAGKCQVRKIKASGGFMSSNLAAAHFGLGNTSEISLIVIRWPDGEISTIHPKSLSNGEIVISRK